MAQEQVPRSERTERPTPKRLEKAYEKGNLPRSQDVGQAATLGAFIVWFLFGGAAFGSALAQEVRLGLTSVAVIHEPAELLDGLSVAAGRGMWILAPLCGLLVVVAIASQLVQFGFRPKKKPLNFELEKLNPVKGIKKVFSPENLVAAVKALLKLSVYSVIAVTVIGPAWSDIVALTDKPVHAIPLEIRDVGLDLLKRALIFGVVVAALDVAFSRYRWFRNLYMTKKELRDELRESEGDPQIRSKRRRRQVELSRTRMLDAVESATVVVTNPVHVAVALSYDPQKAEVPVVVAKGRGHIAQKIKERAREASVPCVEDPPLARALERLCKVGETVPRALFRAVAEVVAYVMSRRKGRYQVHEGLDELTRAEARR